MAYKVGKGSGGGAWGGRGPWGSGGGFSQHGGKHGAPKKHASPPPNRPPYRDGVTVSIGPSDAGENRWVKSWMTFPLTPGSLPVGVTGLWSDQQTLGGGTYSSFNGPDSDTIAFSGVLEPPAAYVSVKQAQAGGFEYGVLQTDQELQLSNNPPQRGGTALPPEASVAGVLMQPGGTPGFGNYIDSLVFKEILTQVVVSGELVQMAIGDEFGYNELVGIRSFTWRYEDPDPDTLYYDLSARSVQLLAPLEAVSQKKLKRKAKHRYHHVSDGETLRRIAGIEGLGADAAGVAILIKLNLKLLGSLWVYPDTRYPSTNESAGLQGVIPAGAQRGDGHPYGQQSARHFNPDMPLRQGITLTLQGAGSGGHERTVIHRNHGAGAGW